MLILNEIVELSVEEEDLLNSEDDDDTSILAAAATYLRRDLHRNEGFFENILPGYSIDEFKSHVVISKSNIRIFPSFQALSRA